MELHFLHNRSLKKKLNRLYWIRVLYFAEVQQTRWIDGRFVGAIKGRIPVLDWIISRTVDLKSERAERIVLRNDKGIRGENLGV
jgi:hypothetical protein